MVHRSTVFLFTITWIFSAVLAFAFVAQWEEELPVQATAALSVGGWDRNESSEQLYSDLEQFADSENITFAKVVEATEGWYGERTLYTVEEDPEVELGLSDGDSMAGFARHRQTTVRDFGDLGDRTVSGPYVVFGNEDKANLLAEFLSSRGLHPSVNLIHRADNYIFIFVRTLTTAAAVMALTLIVISAATVLLGSKAYAVGRMHGMGFFALFMNDLREIGKVWSVTGLMVAGTSTVLLAWYNSLFAFGVYATVLIVTCSAFTVCMVAAHGMALKVTTQTRIIEGIKGEISGRSAIFMSYLLRAIVLGVVATLAGQAVMLASDLNDRGTYSAKYEDLGEMSYPHLGGTGGSSEELEASVPIIAEWIRGQMNSGNVLIAGESSMSQTLSPEVAGYPVMDVNDVYFDRNQFELSDGSEYKYGGTGSDIEILVPASRWSNSDEVFASIESYRDIYRAEVRDRLSFSIIQAADQSVFTYSTETRDRLQLGAESRDASYIDSPIIVVSSSRDAVYTDSVYDAWASQGRVYFFDPDMALSEVAESDRLSDYVLGMTMASSAASEDAQEQQQKFREVMFSLVAASAALIVTALGSAFLYGRKNAQMIFARHINGWRFSGVHRAFIMVESMILLFLLSTPLLRVWFINWRELSTYSNLGVPPPVTPAVVTTGQFGVTIIVAALVLIGIAAVVLNVHRRIVREGSSEA